MTEFWPREHKWKLCATSGNIFKMGACSFFSPPPSFCCLDGAGIDGSSSHLGHQAALGMEAISGGIIA